MDSCNIKVAIKARPLNHKEQLDGRIYWKIESNSIIPIDPSSEKKKGDPFIFDRVFDSHYSNNDVFDEIVKPIIDRGVQGFNGTVFAYGQTSSGKTFTMSGDSWSPGIIPLAVNYMFNAMNSSSSREYLLRACYLEIYNEKIIDLLEKKDNKIQTRKIEIQKDGLHITPLKAIVCQNAQMVIDLMKIGEKNRSIGETNMNERSSRSHTIFRIILESRNIEDDCDGAYQQSVINLVDLAGSERTSQTQPSMERFKEGCKINSSLTTLGLVIQQLSECQDSSQHINFRDSKLTRILQTSLGGNSLTAIICTITLAVDDQTLNTLSFASRAKKIKNTAKVNENVTDETLLKRYRVQISKLNKELEGIKQNQYENDEVNEIKYKYQEEKRTNEELKERIMRLQKNMITSSAENKDQSQTKRGFNRRRTWGGKLDNTFFSNSILETIEEDINLPRPSVPSNFGVLNKETFKTPLEPFEWDLIREERCTVDQESSVISNVEISSISPPPGVCETPRKVLRERVNNYKSLFEMSLRENNELREFTTLERQMFHENNEQLKDLNNLKKQVEELQIAKNASSEVIEKLKLSINRIENEKRDVEVIAEMQKEKYEKREKELLISIQETREELLSKDDQLKKIIASNSDMTEKYEEIKRLEMKIKDITRQNSIHIKEIETLKSELFEKDNNLKNELSKNYNLVTEVSVLQKLVAEAQTIPYAIKLLAYDDHFVMKKSEINELDQLLEQSHYTLEQLQKENQSLKDENNNFKLLSANHINEKSELNNQIIELKSQLNLIETSVRSTISQFCNESDLNNLRSTIDFVDLLKFAALHFDNKNEKLAKLSDENLKLKEELGVSHDKIPVIVSFILENIDSVLLFIASIEEKSSKENRHILNIEEENVFLKSSFKSFEKLTSECANIIEQLRENQLINQFVRDEFFECKFIKNELQLQVNQSSQLITELESSLKNQTDVENKIREELNMKLLELENAYTEIDAINTTHGNAIEELKGCVETTKQELVEKSNTIVLYENSKSELLLKCKELEQIIQLNGDDKFKLAEKEEIEKQLRTELSSKYIELEDAHSKINDMQDCIKELKTKIELNLVTHEQLNNELQSLISEVSNKSELSVNMNSTKLELNTFSDESNFTNKLNNVSANSNKLKNNTDKTENSLTQVNDSTTMIEDIIEEIKLNISSSFTENQNSQLQIEQINHDGCSEEIKQLTTVINGLKTELETHTLNENKAKYMLHEMAMDFDYSNSKIIEIKSIIDNLNNEHGCKKLTVEQLSTDLEYLKTELTEKNKLILELENTNLELLQKCSEFDKYEQLDKIVEELKFEVETKTEIESDLRTELSAKSNELDTIRSKTDDVQNLMNEMKIAAESSVVIVEQLNEELIIARKDLAEKTSLINELENWKSEKENCSEEYDLLHKTIIDLQVKLEDIKTTKQELQQQLLAKTTSLDDALVKENEVQTLVESMENEIQTNITTIQHLKQQLESLLAEKSDILATLEDTKLSLLAKSNEMDNVIIEKLKFEEECYNSKNLKNEFEKVTQHNTVLQTEVNEVNKKLIDMSKHCDAIKLQSDNKLQIQIVNYKQLQEEFTALSRDIELILALKTKTELQLREEVQFKSGELADAQKQLMELSIQHEYDILEEEYMIKSREFAETQNKLLSLETLLSQKEESEKILQDKYKAKCNELNEYKRSIEFLCSRNDSFLTRVEDFEDNVLVALNDEFDSMKLELEKKSEIECTLMNEKSELALNLSKIQDELQRVTTDFNIAQDQIIVLKAQLVEVTAARESLVDQLNVLGEELIKSKTTNESINNELYVVNKELENNNSKISCLENDLETLKLKFDEKINKNDIKDDSEARNQLIDPLVDHVHEIKLKLTELNSAMISGNQSEKQFRTKCMVLDDILPLEDAWKLSCGNQPGSPVEEIELEIETLRKVLEDKSNLVSSLQETKIELEKNIAEQQDKIKDIMVENKKLAEQFMSAENDLKDKYHQIENLNVLLNKLNKQYTEMEQLNLKSSDQLQETKVAFEKNIAELQDKLKEITVENDKLADQLKSTVNDLKEKCQEIEKLNNLLDQRNKQYDELEKNNQESKNEVDHSLDIELELRNGKKNIVNEINLLEPGKITGVLIHHNLTNLLDTFVGLIMTKEQQIVTDLINDHKKVKQQFEDEIRQLQEDIKKAKEWQEQVESDNEKLGLELEELKSLKQNYPSREVEIKELKERVAEAELQSLNYFNELKELKTQISNTNEQNYQLLSDEFEQFKSNTENSMQDLKKKLEDLTNIYNESLQLYEDQKNHHIVLKTQLTDAQSECSCLKSVIEEKEECIQKLVQEVIVKSKEYEALSEKNTLQREEIIAFNCKKIDELQLELNDKIQKLYNTEKLLKETTKNYNVLHEENKLHLQQLENLQFNDGPVSDKLSELEQNLNKLVVENKKKIEIEMELTDKIEKSVDQCSILTKELEINKSKVNELEKQLEVCHQTIKLKNDQLENYLMKTKVKDDDYIELNVVTDKLRKLFKSTNSLSALLDDVGVLVAKCECLEEEVDDLKRQNMNLDNECETMLIELKSKDDKLLEFLTQEDDLRKANEVLTVERDFLRNKCDQYKNINDDVKKLNEEVCNYQQSIYQLRKEKGQVILQHDKEIKQLKAELCEVHAKNLELLNEHKKLTENAKNLEKSLKEDIQQLNRCIVDKNAKISTLELFFKTNTEELKNKNQDLEHVYKRAREENHMLRKEMRRLKEITSVRKTEQCTQTVEEQSVVSSAMVAGHKSMMEKIAKLENDNYVMKKMLHHRKIKIEELQKQIEERPC
ncbi:kinesin-related protein 4-like [Adelges cooleyi]|uniref:kinesin-related protein 4-like n=1 Tax=Adelges cooleyi TaxID=133065 RepID=UPI0021805A25|nr:kinesin-related protein 4-like [Adelges cooleyi]